MEMRLPFHLQLKHERQLRGWSQANLAEKVGCDLKTMQRWEGGESIPQPYYRQKLVELFGKNAVELGLVRQDHHEGGEAPNPLSSKRDGLTSITDSQPLQEGKEAGADTLNNRCQTDWGEAPSVQIFYGRERELTELEHWIAGDRCRTVVVLGIGGIGKTALAKKLAEQMQDTFEYIFWRSLQNAPPLEHILQDCIQFISNQQRTTVPQETEVQISLLVKYLREHRCLVVLDNFESVLQGHHRAGRYREGNEGYGRLLQRIGETQHQSCFLLTSREKPKEIASSAGKAASVRTDHLSGVGEEAGREILKGKDLFGSGGEWKALIEVYSGNPLALKLISEPMQEVFGGDIAAFLKEGVAVFGDIQDLLDQQFHRLSEQEQEILFWLAIEREPVSLDELQEDVGLGRAFIETLNSLGRRSMIETDFTKRFTLQPVIMEYVTNELMKQIHVEIDTEELKLLASHALIKAQAKDYVRDSQIRVILLPLAQQLLKTLGIENLEKKLKKILSTLPGTYFYGHRYTAGNILNLLIQTKYDLSGYDFSHLVVRQAFLQAAMLPNVNFSHANFVQSVFTDTFGDILSVTFSPDGKLLAAGSTNGEVRVWQASSGMTLLTCKGHVDYVWSVTFNSDASILASGSSDGTVLLWEAGTGQCLKTLQGHTTRVRSVAFSPDGKIIASGSEDHTVRLWEVNTGRCFKTLKEHFGQVRSVVFSPDGNVLASGSTDQTIRLWEVSTGHCLKTLQGHANPVCSIIFNSDGSMLASGSEDHTIRLWEVSTGHCLKTLQGHTDVVRSVVFSPDGSMLASGSEDHTIRLWEVSTGHCLKTLQGHDNWVWTVNFNPDGSMLASGSNDHTVRLWEVGTGRCLKILQGYINWIRSVAFNPDGSMLASGSSDNTVRLWEASTGYCLKTLQGHINQIFSVVFSPDGSMLASGSSDNTVKLWEVSTGHCLKTLLGHTDVVRSVVFSPNGSMLASGSEDHTIRLWEVSTGRCLKTLQGNSDIVRSVAFNPDGSMLASGNKDHTVLLWEINTGYSFKTLQGHTNPVCSVVFDPHGRILASGSDDQSVRLWEISTGYSIKTLQGHVSPIRAVVFSPNGSMLASGSEDHTIRLWDVSTGHYLKTLQGHINQVSSIAFKPDGNVLASGSHDGTIKLWDVHTEACLRTMRIDRPYERMNITGATGLTEAQKATLKALGAIENKE